jgi:hypothetical protein
MAMAVLLLALWATLGLARDTPIARLLHRIMVEQPATALNRVNRGDILLAIVLIGLGSLIAWYGEADGVRMLSMAVPDAAVWLTTFEVSAYLDVLAALAATAALVRLRSARIFLMALLAPLMRRPAIGDARPRCSRRRAVIAPANDDGGGAGLALAS